MVKVVNTVPHPSVVKEVVCRSCGATLEYVPNDIQEGKSYDYTGDYDIIHFIKCPPCGHEIQVKR